MDVVRLKGLMVTKRVPILLTELCLLALLLGIGCASNNVEKIEDLSDELLFSQGMEKMGKEDWDEAVDTFTKLERYFPRSPHLEDARLAKADAHFNKSSIASYIEALAEYQAFQSFYPSSPKLDYVQFQIGMCYFKQMYSYDRDPAYTLQAYQAFQTFLERYPQSTLREEGLERFNECNNRLARHEFAVGEYYFKRKAYLPAIQRLRGILKDYPDSDWQDETYYFLAESLWQLDNHNEAAIYFRKLIEEYPNNQFVAQAQERLASLKKEEEKKPPIG